MQSQKGEDRKWKKRNDRSRQKKRNPVYDTDTDTPVSGTAIGKKPVSADGSWCEDIALLRTQGYPIISARGYLLDEPKQAVRTRVCHTNEQVEDELTTIVDLGDVWSMSWSITAFMGN